MDVYCKVGMVTCMWDMNVSIYWKNSQEEDMPGARLGHNKEWKKKWKTPLINMARLLWLFAFTRVLLWQNPSDIAVLWLNIQLFNPKLMADDILNVLIFPALSVVTFAISDTFYHYIVDSSHGTTLGTTLKLNFILKHFLPRYPPMLCLPKALDKLYFLNFSL